VRRQRNTARRSGFADDLITLAFLGGGLYLGYLYFISRNQSGSPVTTSGPYPGGLIDGYAPSLMIDPLTGGAAYAIANAVTTPIQYNPQIATGGGGGDAF
jgi:hypothetical protein